MSGKCVEIKTFTARPVFDCSRSGGFDLQWDVDARGFTPAFMPEISENGAGDWVPLLDAPTEDLFVDGVGPKSFSFHTLPTFRLVVLNGADIAAVSAPVRIGNRLNRHDYLIWREIVRREDLGLVKYNGTPGLLLRRKVSSQPCPDCTDEVLGSVTDSRCETCNGSGYLGGFYPGVPMFADWEAAILDKNYEQTPLGPSEKKLLRFLTHHTPEIKTGDVWVDAGTNFRFEVVKVEPQLFRTEPTSQLVEVSRLPATDPAYRISFS